MFKKILVAYDGEKQSQKALDFAVNMAKNAKAELFVVTSPKIPDPNLLDMYFGNDIVKLSTVENDTNSYYEKKLSEAAAVAEKEGLSVKTVLLKGNPGEAIVEFSAKEDIDLIVMGSNNRGIISRTLLGSVSNHVIYNAVCAVTVIKN